MLWLVLEQVLVLWLGNVSARLRLVQVLVHKLVLELYLIVMLVLVLVWCLVLVLKMVLVMKMSSCKMTKEKHL